MGAVPRARPPLGRLAHGPGRDHLLLPGVFTDGWTRERRVEYQRPFAPIPEEWVSWPPWGLGLDEDDEASYAEVERPGLTGPWS